MSRRRRRNRCKPAASINGAISRRRFLATGAAAGGALLAGGLGLSRGQMLEERPDLAVAHGPDVVRNTRAVIESMGGMEGFVGKGQVVNILPNAQGSHPGTSTSPELVRTVVELCRQSGARQVRWLTWISGGYWEKSNIAGLMKDSGAELVQVDADDDKQWKVLEVPRGVALKHVRVFKALWEADVFISLPIFKDHIGSRFTGVLKNYMGTSHPTDNRTFHPTFEGDDLLHMEQSIADLNTVVRPPDLIVADAMTVLTSNGPFGPGDIARPRRVVAGIDRVAVDCYGATLLGLEGSQVSMIRKSHEHGLGEIDLTRPAIKQIEAG